MKYFILLIFLFFSSASCVKDVLKEPGQDNKKPVVNCLISNTGIQTLKLNFNKSINDHGQMFEEIPEAEISLYENGISVGQFQKTGFASWSLNFTPTEGAVYQLKVSISGYPEMSAVTTMPYRVKIKKRGIQDYGFTKLLSNENGGLIYWMYCLTSNKAPAPFDEPPTENDLLMDRIGTDNPYTDHFSQSGSMSDVNPAWSTPAYKFYVRTVVDSTTPPFDFKVQSNHAARSYVVFQSASKSYDEYLKSSLSKMFMYEHETDPIRFFDENVVYSNITNGLGIFGAYYQSWIQF